MCGKIESDLMTGWQWRTVKKRLKKLGIKLKEQIPCSSQRNNFYRRAAYMTTEDLKNHFNSG